MIWHDSNIAHLVSDLTYKCFISQYQIAGVIYENRAICKMLWMKHVTQSSENDIILNPVKYFVLLGRR